MQTKRQMLSSDNRARFYSALRQASKPMTLCRGLAPDDRTFFYSDDALWSNGCHVWVDNTNSATVCPSCLAYAYHKLVSSQR